MSSAKWQTTFCSGEDGFITFDPIKGNRIDISHKSQDALFPYPTMQHFVTEMCTCVHISVTKCGIFVWCIVGFVRWDHLNATCTHPCKTTIQWWCDTFKIYNWSIRTTFNLCGMSLSICILGNASCLHTTCNIFSFQPLTRKLDSIDQKHISNFVTNNSNFL